MATFTVVIPFYQKEPGILRRALASIFNQTYQDFDIVVVDDESPLPADIELQPLDDVQKSRITVIKQANGGPGGARNTGLDNVPTSTRFVAFLDSDDLWLPDHLKNAHESLTRFGGDCYLYCMMAAGFIDIVAESGLKPFDIAPLIPIIRAAGGMVTTWDGGDPSSGGQILACGDPALHEQALKVLAG